MCWEFPSAGILPLCSAVARCCSLPSVKQKRFTASNPNNWFPSIVGFPQNQKLECSSNIGGHIENVCLGLDGLGTLIVVSLL